MKTAVRRAAESLLGVFGSRTPALPALRDLLGARLRGKRCLILGSAPNAVAPELSRIDACVCVNGSPWTAARFGIGKVDLTVVSGHKTKVREKVHDVSAATLEAWNDLSTELLLFVEIGDTAQHGRAVLRAAGFHYDRFIPIRHQARVAIIEAAFGTQLASEEARVSNGIFAAAAAVWAGAGELVFAGFSMQGGHSYMQHDTRRGHQEGDGRFFQAAKAFPYPVATTSDELHRLFGLPLVAAAGTRA